MNTYAVTVLVTRQYTISVEADDDDVARDAVCDMSSSDIEDGSDGVPYSTEVIGVECTEEEDDGECPNCGGSGGGGDDALNCGTCSGSGSSRARRGRCEP